jgi:hypothetical protein
MEEIIDILKTMDHPEEYVLVRNTNTEDKKWNTNTK